MTEKVLGIQNRKRLQGTELRTWRKQAKQRVNRENIRYSMEITVKGKEIIGKGTRLQGENS